MQGRKVKETFKGEATRGADVERRYREEERRHAKMRRAKIKEHKIYQEERREEKTEEEKRGNGVMEGRTQEPCRGARRRGKERCREERER